MVSLKYTGNRKFSVCEDFSQKLSDGRIICVPKGFVTDLSSVPQVFWFLFAPYGDFIVASIVHDYLYKKRLMSRINCDKEMLFLSNKYSSDYLDNYIRFIAVRAFGWIFY